MPYALDGQADLLPAHDTQGALGLVVEDHAAGKAPYAGTRETVAEIREHGAGAYGAAEAADSPPKRLTKYSQVWRMPVAKSISGR